jgi:hypothetical protein
MAFAAVTYVSLEGRDPVESLAVLNDTLAPRLKSLPGFQSARFMQAQDHKTGVGAVIVDTEGHASACLDAMTSERPSEAPPVTSSGIYEVVLEI